MPTAILHITKTKRFLLVCNSDKRHSDKTPARNCQTRSWIDATRKNDTLRDAKLKKRRKGKEKAYPGTLEFKIRILEFLNIRKKQYGGTEL